MVDVEGKVMASDHLNREQRAQHHPKRGCGAPKAFSVDTENAFGDR